MLAFSKLHLRRRGFSLEASPMVFPSKGLFLLQGENGSGKSFLLSCLAGLCQGYEGEITLEGSPLKTMSRLSCAQKISYLPQRAEPFPPLSADSYLQQGLYAGGVNRIEALLEYFQWTPDPAKNCGEFSGGEGQLLRFIRACAVARPLILLDEPESYLSRKRKELLNKLLQEFSRQSLIILAAHDNRLFPSAQIIPLEEKTEGCFWIKPL